MRCNALLLRQGALILFPLMLHAQHDVSPAVQNPALKDPASIAAGAGLYTTSCGGCHGPDGIGGRGPNLVRQLQSHQLKDDELFATIQRCPRHRHATHTPFR